MELVKQWGLGLVVFILMDAVWLGLLANQFYKRELGPLLRQHPDGSLDPRWLPALLLYALIVLGLALFALPRARAGAIGEAALWCAVFGVIAYSVYDLTNYATMEAFPLKVVVVDMIWGGVICAAAGAAMHAVARS
ncbi:MAG: DUF2177 family protein [Acidobacteriota bacterium]|nr:DUF2177 family protein [Acidobacteriota bacterium]